jgi:hypothetical protein
MASLKTDDFNTTDKVERKRARKKKMEKSNAAEVSNSDDVHDSDQRVSSRWTTKSTAACRT